MDDRQSHTERIKWLLGRYPNITPAEAREITALVKHSPDLEITLLKINGEVRPVLERLNTDQRGNFGSYPWGWAGLATAVLIALLVSYTLWEFNVPR